MNTVPGGQQADIGANESFVDDFAVEAFAIAMKEKMHVSHLKGRSGWHDNNQISDEKLASMLIEHIAKGDPVDIANFAMMLHQRGADPKTISAAWAAIVIPSAGHQGKFYPKEMTPELLEVLGLMNYHTVPIARGLRAGGQNIKPKCEEEQAYALHWLIQLALQHGSDWRSKAIEEIKQMRDDAAARTDHGAKK